MAQGHSHRLFGAILGPAAVNGGPPEWIGLAVVLAVMRLTGNDLPAQSQEWPRWRGCALCCSDRVAIRAEFRYPGSFGFIRHEEA